MSWWTINCVLNQLDFEQFLIGTKWPARKEIVLKCTFFLYLSSYNWIHAYSWKSAWKKVAVCAASFTGKLSDNRQLIHWRWENVSISTFFVMHHSRLNFLVSIPRNTDDTYPSIFCKIFKLYFKVYFLFHIKIFRNTK